MAPLLALISSFFYALSMVVARIGLRKSEIITWKIVLGAILIAGAAILLGLIP